MRRPAAPNACKDELGRQRAPPSASPQTSSIGPGPSWTRASTSSCSTPPTATARACSALPGSCGSGSPRLRSSAGTSSPPRAAATSSRPAWMRSKSASDLAVSAPRALSPARECPRLAPSWRRPRPRRQRARPSSPTGHQVLRRHRQGPRLRRVRLMIGSLFAGTEEAPGNDLSGRPTRDAAAWGPSAP